MSQQIQVMLVELERLAILPEEAWHAQLQELQVGCPFLVWPADAGMGSGVMAASYYHATSLYHEPDRIAGHEHHLHRRQQLRLSLQVACVQTCVKTCTNH